MAAFLSKSLALVLTFASLIGAGPVGAQAVWHCSRAMDAVSTANPIEAEDSFQLASSGLSRDAIGISVVDLMDAYGGKPIHVNGRTITACFMPGDSPLSVQGLNSLGLKSSSMQLQARKSAIVQSNLKLVTNEVDMLACIGKNYPALGYLSRIVEDDRVVPCF